MRVRLFCCVVCLVATAWILNGPTAQGATYQWNGSVNSDWEENNNWTPSGAAPFDESGAHRLNVNGGELVYDGSLGTTVYTGDPANFNRGLVIGSGNLGDGTMRITGGVFSTVGATSASVVGNTGNPLPNANTGTLIVDGGTYLGDVLHINLGSPANGVLQINDGSAVIGSLVVGQGSGTNSTAHVGLAGGVLTTNEISANYTSATFHFSGGTLQAGSASETAWMGGLSAYVRNGGAVIDTNSRDVTISTPLLHSNIGGDAALDGGLTKHNAGILTLTGGNSYTGATSITGGTLALSHASSNNIAASASIHVGSGATLDVTGLNSSTLLLAGSQTLGGEGVVTGSVNVASGTTIAPGASIGTLSVSQDVILAGTFAVEFDAASIDLLNVGGSFDIAGGTLSFDELAPLAPGGALIFATYDDLIGSAFGTVLGQPGETDIVYNYQGNNIALVSTAIPEPSALILALVGLVVAGLVRRPALFCRRRQNVSIEN